MRSISGLDGLKSIDLRWGFQDGALVTRLRVAAPVPRRGVLALLDQPAFGVETLPPLPANLTSLFVLSVDLAKTYDQIETLMKLVDPPVPHGPPERRHSRPSWDRPPQGASRARRSPDSPFTRRRPAAKIASTAASMLMSRVAGFTLAAQVRDEAAVLRAIDSLIKSFNPMLREYLRGIPRNRVASSLAFLKFRKLAGTRPNMCWTCLRIRFLAVCDDVATDDHARPGSACGQRSTPAAEQAVGRCPRAARGTVHTRVNRLPAEMVYLGLVDPRAGTAIFTRALPILVRQINAEIALAQRRDGKSPQRRFMRLDPDMFPDAGISIVCCFRRRPH